MSRNVISVSLLDVVVYATTEGGTTFSAVMRCWVWYPISEASASFNDFAELWIGAVPVVETLPLVRRLFWS